MSSSPSPGPSPEVVVLGGGPAGVFAADALLRAGCAVTLIEAGPALGGTHRSREIRDYTFDVGSIFYEESAALFRQFPATLDLCPPARRVQRRIAPDGRLRHYPLEPRDILTWPLGLRLRALRDLILARLFIWPDGSAETATRARLGDTIYRETGLQSYIERFHQESARGIDEEFFHRRMSFIAQKTRTGAILQALGRALLRRPVRKGPPASLRIRPRAGFATLWSAVGQDLVARGLDLRLSTRAEAIRRSDKGYVVATSGGEIAADQVVCALPLQLCHRLVFGEDAREAAPLTSLDLLTLFVSASHVEPEAGNVLFNFHRDGRWKRVTIYSRLYPAPATGRDYFAVEITLKEGETADPAAAFAGFADHVKGLGFMSGLHLEGHEVVKSAYPVYRIGTVRSLNAVLARLEEFGLVLAGRQGRFEYLPTSTGVRRRVAQELERAGLVPAGGTAAKGQDDDRKDETG